MKNNIYYFVLFAFFVSLQSVYAQKEGNVWHFGERAALNFNSGNAVLTSPSLMSTLEGSASIADADGNLLFYTNGGGRDPILFGESSGKIWNRNHQVMYDMGFTEGGGFSAMQSSVIIPKPGDPQNYYLFTMEEIEFNVGGAVPGQPQGRGLSYFEVDMSLNGGLGGVAAYEGSIFVPSYEGLCAIRHTNGSDYWIIVNGNGFGLVVFSVNPNGVSAPVSYNITGLQGGSIKGSPDGKWVSLAGRLLSFNATTGVLGNPLKLDIITGSLEFSPNSKRLFFSTLGDMGYWDLTSPNINSSKVIFGQVPSTDFWISQMQVAPDGKIYFVQSALTVPTIFISAIACPNTTPLLELETFRFNGVSFSGLPNFDNAIFRKDDDPLLPVDLGVDKSICEGQNIVLDAVADATGYTWSTGAQTPSLSVAAPGTYIVTVTGAGCSVGKDTIVVSPFTVAAGEDQIVCRGDTVQLSAVGTGVLSWSPPNLVSDASILSPFFTGDNNNTTLVITANSNGCTVRDSVDLLFIDQPPVVITPGDTTIFVGTSAQLSITGTGTIAWSPTAGLSCVDCANPIATPDTTTTYTLIRTNEAGCSNSNSIKITVVPPDCTPKIPNAFTPNNDTVNDGFEPIGRAIESYNLTIYNRWGQEVFSDTKPWDGQLGGKDAPCDVYIYKVNIQICDNIKTYSGEVTLIR